MRMTNNLSSLSLKLTPNIAVVGETGVGKSSITNLVVSTDSTVTVGTSYHDWNLLETQTFHLWDTPGLDVDPSGGTSAKHAYDALLSLLIVCFQGGWRVTKSMEQTYHAILALRDRVSPNTPRLGYH